MLETHYLDFFSYAMAILRDVDDAKDAVQETMVRVLTARHVDDVVKYTYTALRNEAINVIRRRRRFTTLGDNPPCAESDLEVRLRLVARLRDELPETLRALVELHDEEGYTLSELAVLTGLSFSTVRRRLDEAHDILKKRLSEEES